MTLTTKIKGFATKCPMCGKSLHGLNFAVGIAENGEILPCRPNSMTQTEAELVLPYNGIVKFSLVGGKCMKELLSQGFLETLHGRKCETKFYKKY